LGFIAPFVVGDNLHRVGATTSLLNVLVPYRVTLVRPRPAASAFPNIEDLSVWIAVNIHIELARSGRLLAYLNGSIGRWWTKSCDNLPRLKLQSDLRCRVEFHE